MQKYEIKMGCKKNLIFNNLDRIPSYTGFWLVAGSGIIWASMAMGSGELIWWPYLTAKYGPSFIGLLLPACLLQYFVNQEINRYTATTGEGIFQGFVRLHFLFGILMWIMMVISFAWFGSYVMSGATALAEMVKLPGNYSRQQTCLIFSYGIIAIYAGILFFVKSVYTVIEYFMKIMIVVCILGLLISVFNPVILKTAPDFFYSYFNPLYLVRNGLPSKWSPSDSNILLTAICFAGMGGFLNIMYSYWIRTKGIGVCKIMNEEMHIGYVFLDTHDNYLNYHKWIKHISFENLMAVGINAIMVMIMCWFSWAVLLPQNKYPEGWNIAVVQADFFSVSLGLFGKYLFLIIAAAFLCDTWIGITDACARMHADFFRSTFSFARKYSHKTLYYFFSTFLLIISCVTIPLAQPGPLLILGGIFNFIAMPIYCFALIYLNYYKVPLVFPKWVRPSQLSLIAIVVVTLIYLAIAIWYVTVIFR